MLSLLLNKVLAACRLAPNPAIGFFNRFVFSALSILNLSLNILTRLIRLCINSVAHLASSVLLDEWTPHLKLAQVLLKSKFDRSTSSKSFYICRSTLEYFKEWQKSLASISGENGVVTNQNIFQKFCHKRVKTDGDTPSGMVMQETL